MTKINTGGPAFPFAATDRFNMPLQTQGMTKREEYAKAAMVGILAGGFGDTYPHDDVEAATTVAFFAVNYADALIAALEKDGEE